MRLFRPIAAVLVATALLGGTAQAMPKGENWKAPTGLNWNAPVHSNRIIHHGVQRGNPNNKPMAGIPKSSYPTLPANVASSTEAITTWSNECTAGPYKFQTAIIWTQPYVDSSSSHIARIGAYAYIYMLWGATDEPVYYNLDWKINQHSYAYTYYKGPMWEQSVTDTTHTSTLGRVSLNPRDPWWDIYYGFETHPWIETWAGRDNDGLPMCTGMITTQDRW